MCFRRASSFESAIRPSSPEMAPNRFPAQESRSDLPLNPPNLSKTGVPPYYSTDRMIVSQSMYHIICYLRNNFWSCKSAATRLTGGLKAWMLGWKSGRIAVYGGSIVPVIASQRRIGWPGRPSNGNAQSLQHLPERLWKRQTQG